MRHAAAHIDAGRTAPDSICTRPRPSTKAIIGPPFRINTPWFARCDAGNVSQHSSYRDSARKLAWARLDHHDQSAKFPLSMTFTRFRTPRERGTMTTNESDLSVGGDVTTPSNAS